MEKGFVKMPFSIELAKKITSGKKEGNVDLMLEIPEVNTFTPGMPVLGFDGRGEWRYDIFSHIRLTTRGTTYYVCSGRSYKKIVPFNGNEILVGTKDI